MQMRTGDTFPRRTRPNSNMFDAEPSPCRCEGWDTMVRSFRTRSIFIAPLAILCTVALSAATRDARPLPSPPKHTLTAFRNDAQLVKFLKRIARSRPAMMFDEALPPPAPPPTTAGAAQASASAPAEKAASPSITNNQEANVDEGDIVKMHGNTMVILRRGRLFTVSLARDGVKPVDSIDAYPPGVDASADWYDEMLVSKDLIVVIGYSYGRGGTEVNRFRIDDAGHLAFEDAYQLRSNDYYSSRNYASRLVGHTLIFYSPLEMGYAGGDPLEALPALRRWDGKGTAPGFKRIASASQIYIPPALLNDPKASVDTLHTVSRCDLLAPRMNCSAISVLGPNSRSFYVSENAVYVWVSDPWGDDRGRHASSLLYRLPVDGSAPQALATRGVPTDQFSFREDARGNELDVLVRSEGAGDKMWHPEFFPEGAVALLRLPLGAFGDGSEEASAHFYRALPKPKGSAYDFHNRFVGDDVLYGNGNGWGTPDAGSNILTVVPVKGGEPTELDVGYGIDRIEPMGASAVVIGSDQHSTYFSAIELRGREARLGDRYVQPESAQAETRSHAFFFSPDPDSGYDSDGVLGLPIARPARPAYRQLFENSISMVFVRRTHGHFSSLGTLDSSDSGIADDACVASCVDWYGNARPIFLPGRTLALMGYEIVEGKLSRDAITEAARMSFAPKAVKVRAGE